MDHLEYPLDCLPLEIPIPLVATDKYIDAVAFDSYPSKRGYRFAQGRISSKEILRHGPARAIAFIQEWMWFGPLKFTLGDAFIYKDFVRSDPNTGRNVVSTQRLKEWAFLEKRKPRTVDDTVPTLCRKMIGICDILDRTDTSLSASAGWAKDWAAVWLSIRILIETLLSLGRKSKKSHSRTRTGAPPKNSASWQLLVSTVLERPGWCCHQVEKSRESMSFTAMVYLGSLQRYPKAWVDHDKCQNEKNCVALNIDKSTFESVHVEPGCSCDAIEAPVEEMHDIVRGGGIVYVQCARAKNGELRLLYRRATPCTRYVAISHLWSDGIGNPHRNSIFRCQLEQLVERVASTDAAISKIPIAESITAPIPGGNNLRRRMLGNTTAAPSSGGYVVNFWLDALCVPVVLPEHDSRRMLSCRLKSLSNMPLTFAMASGVLALDKELDHVTPNMNEAEVTARIAVSGINTRCWVYHEASFGRSISYWCGHGPITIAPWMTTPSQSRHKRLELIPARVTSERALRLARNWCPLLDTPCSATLGKEAKLIEREKPDAADKKYAKLTHGDKLRLYLSETINLSRSPARNGYRLTGRNWSKGALRGRLYNNRAVRFGYVWNALRARSSTNTEDAVMTLANLLDLDAFDIVAMHPEQRMKAILRAYRCFPADVLFASGLERLSGDDGSNWVPAHPIGSESLTFREWRPIRFNSRAERLSSPGLAHNAVEITPDGVLLKHLTIVVEQKQPKKPKTFHVGKDAPLALDSSEFKTPKKFTVPWKVVKLNGPLVATGYFHLNGKDIYGAPDAAFYHFKLERKEAATSQSGSAGNILLILNYPRGPEAEHKSVCNGCAVIRTGMKDKIARSTYVCPLTWYRVPDTYARQSGNLFEAEVQEEMDVLICSDIGRWPRTRLRENVFGREPRDENVAIYGLVYAAPFGAALGVGLAMADQYNQLVPDSGFRTVVSLAISFHAAAVLSATLQFLLHSFRYAQHWLALLEYQQREEREDPWWKVLDQASPDADSVLAFGSGKSAWYFLSMVIAVYRGFDALWRACGYSKKESRDPDVEPEIELHEIRNGVWTKNGSSAVIISSPMRTPPAPPVIEVIPDD